MPIPSVIPIKDEDRKRYTIWLTEETLMYFEMLARQNKRTKRGQVEWELENIARIDAYGILDEDYRLKK